MIPLSFLNPLRVIESPVFIFVEESYMYVYSAIISSSGRERELMYCVIFLGY